MQIFSSQLSSVSTLKLKSFSVVLKQDFHVDLLNVDLNNSTRIEMFLPFEIIGKVLFLPHKCVTLIQTVKITKKYKEVFLAFRCKLIYLQLLGMKKNYFSYSLKWLGQL